MKITIIDYKSGNLQSVLNALKSLQKGHEIVISNRIEDIRSATHLILPGVGAFGDCMRGLKAEEGLLTELRKQVMIEAKPIIGICVGMQVLASMGYENGEHQGLGFIDGKAVKIETAPNLKIPHMGWNQLVIRLEQAKHPILKSIKTGDHVYFANSYHFLCQNEGNVLAQVEYGVKINAVIAKKNIIGIQFHPEKSGETGLQILNNFLDWRY